MGRQAMQAVLAGLALVGVMGCGATVWWGKRSKTISLGMSRQQVQTLLGPPRHVLTQQLQGLMVETWKYLDRTVTFHNGVVQSWEPHPPP
jgi:hypothetical protein